MNFETKNFDHLLGIEGLSEEMLNNHFGLYAGYVANTNKLLDEIGKYQKEGTAAAPQYAELKRRFGWEFDGMRLHELYFGNLSKEKTGLAGGSDFEKQIEKDFGSFDAWQKDFKATLAMRGIGWAILYYDWQGERLFNTWINEHDRGHLAACCPVLVVDAFEHAYMLDYGTKKAEYIEAIMPLANWIKCEERYVMARK
ncbi:MAG TPA: Fe-Mn family superoxide dismutase [Candidatus Bathyarchaeia archaeon]|nr:Fe-Mn family superoxide dismutase [Candidatus Bathyarchaeia archaeon]